MSQKEKKIIQVRRKSLAIINDVSKTFMPPSGGLPVSGGDEIVPGIVQLINQWPCKSNVDLIYEIHPYGSVSLRDSYILPASCTSLSFAEFDRMNYKQRRAIIAPHAIFTTTQLWEHLLKAKQILWPTHADPEKPEETLPHPDLLALAKRYNLKMFPKGMSPYCDSYSAFFDDEGRPTGYHELVTDRDIKDIFIVGLAFDYCVGLTGVGAIDRGFRKVYVVKDLTRSVSPASEAAMIARLKEKGVHIINSDQLVFE